MLEPLDPRVALAQVLVACFIGAVAGIGHARLRAHTGTSPLGTIWTAAMASMLGATLVLLTGHTGRGTAAGFAVVAVATGAVPHRSFASTPEAVAGVIPLLAYWAGAYAGAAEWHIAAAVTSALTTTIGVVHFAEGRLQSLPPDDAGAALTFGAIATIAFYLLPNANLGPWGVLNPRELWRLAVIVSVLSFVVFVIARLWRRAHGLYVAGALSGFFSSTAFTMALAKQSRQPNGDRTLAIAAALSSLVMIVRVGVLAQAAGPAVVQRLLPLLAAMVGSGAVAALWLMRGTRSVGGAVEPARNPIRWQQVIRFAVFFALVKLCVEVMLRNRGAAGVIWTAGAAGLVDVDAITLTLAGIAGRTFDPRAAANAIGVAILANIGAKVGYALVRGDRTFWSGFGAVLGAAFAAGAIALAVT